MSSLNITVIGAGVVGLTTALKIQELGHRVTIVAEYLPGDEKSIRYTSPWAGAHHVSFFGDEDPKQRDMDRETFRVMWEMSAGPAEACFMRIQQTEYYAEPKAAPNPLDVMPNFRYLEPSQLKAGAASGVEFETVTIDSPVYLLYLLTRFLQNGGQVKRASVQHISQLVSGGFLTSKPDALVVCAGIGARTLGGVEDRDVFPIRGQTVLIRAPWVNFGRTLSSVDGTWTYIIPRRSGDVILGGTKANDDWHPHPRPETTTDILERTLSICPELVPPEKLAELRRKGVDPKPEDLQSIILETGCGLRPGRKGGIRLERGLFQTIDGHSIPIVYNYGHGGYGYQSSWGSARIATDLLKEALA
ncbi:FAD dependent oxidoreductase [Sistotremastrum suecicum HHB10207 ss-3]|uniref:FAD dependent oxidoreductase n=1 Tax=Sistotremastrum suecicum HHB10207 ss-3 TaxID=1314776 RepID=A0A165ZQS6_9AGAM|nr:FAD dependent oxidoreductase [Sistotremastrum suecicum HHB10207 ss-3]